ncbi:MAG TPA: DUF3054 family protein [Gaiellaceae bacterium]|nr:DUF3054 family protein [Gaiellaceae bacterium]
MILLFVTIGQLSHRGGVSAAGYAEDALPFVGAWLVAFRAFAGRFLPTWLVGVTLGVAIRAVVLSHYRWSELSFWLVALAFIGAVAFAMRRVSRTALRRRTAR